MPEREELRKHFNTDSLVKDDLILWDAGMLQDKIPLYDCKAVMNDDTTLFKYLYSLYQYGLVLLDDGPVRQDFLFELATRIGWFQKTYLGDINNLKVEDNPISVGCTAKGLYIHTDLPYLRSSPDIQALHCLEQSPSGGMSTFADGFHAVKQLKRDSPDAFRVLTTFPMRFYDEGVADFGEYCFGFSAPMIKMLD
ncbi:gamma-butyrobetaine dioxygenase-like [Paramuricea clavata]|nr:gamma-butyrobetaine dioxygenase-like [Paramuricea clavata]